MLLAENNSRLWKRMARLGGAVWTRDGAAGCLTCSSTTEDARGDREEFFYFFDRNPLKSPDPDE